MCALSPLLDRSRKGVERNKIATFSAISGHGGSLLASKGQDRALQATAGHKILDFLGVDHALFVKYRPSSAIFAHHGSRLARGGHEWSPLPLSAEV
jgi:aspartate-semialdehyde dehydrogenase